MTKHISKNTFITKKATQYEFYDELDKLDELILENFLENDLLDSPMISWYEEKDDENEDDVFVTEEDSPYCDSHYEYCSCEEELLDDYENDSEWETIRYN